MTYFETIICVVAGTLFGMIMDKVIHDDLNKNNKKL